VKNTSFSPLLPPPGIPMGERERSDDSTILHFGF
jgi:hypothetical protein